MVRFVSTRDKARVFAFVPQTALSRPGKPDEKEDTVVLWEGDRFYERSTAALRILYLLGWPWRAFYVLIIVPRPWRDAVYRFVAVRRHRWFGTRDRCFLP